MRSIPRSVPIGPGWKVSRPTTKTLARDHGNHNLLFGDSNQSNRRIRVVKELTGRDAWEVLFHEMVHSAFFEAQNDEVSIDLGDMEEPIVKTLQRHLFPALVALGFGSGRGGKNGDS